MGKSSRSTGSVGSPLASLERADERLRDLAARFADPRNLALLCAAVVGAGAILGLLIVYLPDPAAVQALERYQPSIHSTLYDDDGRPFEEWVIKKRQVVVYDDIPENLRNAVVAAEDSRFFSHVGIDPIGVLRAIWRNITRGFGEEGASTITMQLSRDLWLSPDKNITRKLIEAFYYTLQTERYFSKERIFELYATQTFMGHNVYGFSTAADYYFGKRLADLTLPEAALLAGMIQRPNAYNPYRFPDAALRKRALVLDRMVDEDYITEEEATAAKETPLELGEGSVEDRLGAYFVEEIRKKLQPEYRTEIYESGLQVHTTLDRELQAAAERALRSQLRAIDKQLGWRGEQDNLIDKGEDPVDFNSPRWNRPIQPGDWVPAVVEEVTPELATVRIGPRAATFGPEGAAWTRRSGTADLTQLVARGDVISVQVREIGDDGSLTVALDQDPEIEGAVLVVENITGEVKAMVGGDEFDRSEFNRATQAERQTGSAFKPFVYAAALAEDWTASDLMLDMEKRFEDPTTQVPYEPSNYEDQYVGITTLAEALAKSRNVVTVELQQEVGADRVIEMARDLGLTANLQPYLSLALGVIDASLWEMTRAYAVFPNGGVRVEPHLVREIRDRQGRVLRKTERQNVQVMDNDVAYLMTRMLVNVVEFQKNSYEGGTARRARPLARDLQMDLGGKTGTTDDYSDAWFIGFSPYHTIGVWVGNDTKKPIGPGREGANTALPIWMEVMRAASRGLPPKGFSQPARVVLRTVDPYTGLLASDACDATVQMAYIEGTEPTAVCTTAQHEILSLPYYNQAYFIDQIQARGGSRPDR